MLDPAHCWTPPRTLESDARCPRALSYTRHSTILALLIVQPSVLQMRKLRVKGDAHSRPKHPRGPAFRSPDHLFLCSSPGVLSPLGAPPPSMPPTPTLAGARAAAPGIVHTRQRQANKLPAPFISQTSKFILEKAMAPHSSTLA